MSEYIGDSNACVRCIRSSPVASLIGLLLVLVGASSFGVATIYARRRLASVLEQPHLFQCLEYVVYGLVGVVLLFAFLAYLTCALSSGRNAKRCFESNHKTACGSCFNMTLIVCLAAGVLVWAAIACIMSYPVISATLLLHRQEGPTRLLLAPLSITDLDKSRRYIPFHKPKFLDEQGYSQVQRKRREEPPRSSSFVQRPLKTAVSEDGGETLSWGPETLHSQSSSPTFDLNSLETINAVPLPEIPEPLSSQTDEEKGAWRLADLDTNMTAGAVDDGMHKLQSLDPRKLGQEANRLIGAAAKFFRCAPNAVDLSYYGLYDEKRLPICLSGNRVDEFTRELTICSGIAMVGILMVITGHVQIAICATINYTRLQRHRYYECSDVGEEGEALHQ